MLAQAFVQVWDELYNPRSGCPDVSLSMVRSAMIKVLIRHEAFGSFPYQARWVLAFVAIAPGRSFEDLSCYWDDDDPKEPLDRQVVDDLCAQGLLVQRDQERLFRAS